MPGYLFAAAACSRRPLSEVASPVAFGEYVQSDRDIEGITWRKSSWSAVNGNCVEVADLPSGLIAVRDTKNSGCGPVLTFGHTAWGSFVKALKSGDLFI
jgi:Domain of unknown function (DUF397)